MSSLSKYLKELTVTEKFIRSARELLGDNQVSAQALHTLLQIAMHPDGIEQATLLKKANLTRSNGTKHIADLSDLTARKQPGPGLVESRIDPMHRSFRQIHLTPKGRIALEKALASAWGEK